MMYEQSTRAAALTALAQSPSLTGLPFTLAGVAGWEAETRLCEALTRAGERGLARGYRRGAAGASGAVWHNWWVFLARYYVRETWDGCPGPWPVKVLLTVIAVAEPGPWGEIALGALAKWNGRRKAQRMIGRQTA